MVEQLSNVASGASPAPPAVPRPRFITWLSTCLVFLLCVWSFCVGVGFLVSAPAQDLGWPLISFFEPVLMGIFNMLVSGLVAWWQYAAVLRRSATRSIAVGALLLVTGALSCLGPWDIVRDTA